LITSLWIVGAPTAPPKLAASRPGSCVRSAKAMFGFVVRLVDQRCRRAAGISSPVGHRANHPRRRSHTRSDRPHSWCSTRTGLAIAANHVVGFDPSRATSTQLGAKKSVHRGEIGCAGGVGPGRKSGSFHLAGVIWRPLTDGVEDKNCWTRAGLLPYGRRTIEADLNQVGKGGGASHRVGTIFEGAVGK